MKRLGADWQGLCYREGGVRRWCTCYVCGLSLTIIRGLEMQCCSLGSPHSCTMMALPCLPSETRVQLLKHVAGSPCYTTQGRAMHPGGCRICQVVLFQ